MVVTNKQHLIFDLYNGISYQEENKMTYRDTTITSTNSSSKSSS